MCKDLDQHGRPRAYNWYDYPVMCAPNQTWPAAPQRLSRGQVWPRCAAWLALTTCCLCRTTRRMLDDLYSELVTTEGYEVPEPLVHQKRPQVRRLHRASWLRAASSAVLLGDAAPAGHAWLRSCVVAGHVWLRELLAFTAPLLLATCG